MHCIWKELIKGCVSFFGAIQRDFEKTGTVSIITHSSYSIKPRGKYHYIAITRINLQLGYSIIIILNNLNVI